MANEKKAAPEAAAQTCSVKNGDKACKRPFRAKGMCVTHYKMWRRGELADHKGRYKTCSKEGCRKPRALGGLCAEHAGKGEAAAEAPAA
jgi:hypothetical protein